MGCGEGRTELTPTVGSGALLPKRVRYVLSSARQGPDLRKRSPGVHGSPGRCGPVVTRLDTQLVIRRDCAVGTRRVSSERVPACRELRHHHTHVQTIGACLSAHASGVPRTVNFVGVPVVSDATVVDKPNPPTTGRPLPPSGRRTWRGRRQAHTGAAVATRVEAAAA